MRTLAITLLAAGSVFAQAKDEGTYTLTVQISGMT